MTYDPDRFDAEIILDRSGELGPYTTDVLCRLFDVNRSTICTWSATTTACCGATPRNCWTCSG